MKQTAHTQKPNNGHNKRTTTASSSRPTNHGTTPSWFARSVEKVGHSARDCRNRVPGASAYKNVPYEKQSTTENREFRRDFKQSQNNRQPAYQVSQVTEQTAQTEILDNCFDVYDVEYNDEFDSNSKKLVKPHHPPPNQTTSAYNKLRSNNYYDSKTKKTSECRQHTDRRSQPSKRYYVQKVAHNNYHILPLVDDDATCTTTDCTRTENNDDS